MAATILTQTASYSVEIWTADGSTVVPAGNDEAAARVIFAAFELTAGEHAECLSLISVTPTDEEGWEDTVRVLACS